MGNKRESSPINKGSRISIKPGIVLKEEPDNWGILYNPENDFSFGINPVGVLTWNLLQACKAKPTVSQLSALVQIKCNNAPPEANEEIENFLQVLVEKELVDVETGE